MTIEMEILQKYVSKLDVSLVPNYPTQAATIAISTEIEVGPRESPSSIPTNEAPTELPSAAIKEVTSSIANVNDITLQAKSLEKRITAERDRFVQPLLSAFSANIHHLD